MTILFILGLIIIFLISFYYITALFVSKEYYIQRETIIHRPKQEVYDYLRHLKNQDHFSEWVMMDPDLKKEFSGTDGVIGFVYAWEGKKAGIGQQEIKNLVEGEKIDVEIRFVKPFPATAKVPFTTEAFSENETKVTWAMDGRSDYPRNFMNLFLDSMLGKSMDKSLKNLKNILEK